MFEKLEDRCDGRVKQRGGRVNSDECRDFYRDPAKSHFSKISFWFPLLLRRGNQKENVQSPGLPSIHPDGCRDMVPELIEGLEDRCGA
jgi:hypothetical protein